jgi:predicted dehydrogenase
VNNLQSLVGDIVRAQATTSSAARGFLVEDTAAMVFTFANGALGTFLLCDTAASARSGEQTSQEATSYSTYPDEDCYHLAGSTGSLSLPTMRLEVFPGTRSWWEPFHTSTVALERSDPLVNQIEHFAAVIRGEAEPVCSGREGPKTLRGGGSGRGVRAERAAGRSRVPGGAERVTRACAPRRGRWSAGGCARRARAVLSRPSGPVLPPRGRC